jgi:phosphatidylglycerophosphate synthase
MTPPPATSVTTAVALVVRAALLAGAGTGAVTALAVTVQRVFAFGEAFPVRVAFVAGGVMLVALAGLRPHHPFTHVGPANLVTGTRALLVALLAAVALEPAVRPLGWWLVGTATLAASLDLADGWLARRTGLASAFGARFDMEVDSLLILVLSVLVWRAGLSGAWVLGSGLMRYVFVAAAFAVPWMNRALPSSRRRQAICVVQIVALIAALAPVVAPAAALALAAASLALPSWSFAIDVRWLARRRREGR